MTSREVLEYVIQAKADFKEVQGAASQLQKLLNNLRLPKNLSDGFNDLFSKLSKEMDSFYEKSQNIVDKKGLNDLKKQGNEIRNIFKEITQSYSKNITRDVWFGNYSSEEVDKLREKLTTLKNELNDLSGTKNSGIQTLKEVYATLAKLYKNEDEQPKSLQALKQALDSGKFERINQIKSWLDRLQATSSQGLSGKLAEGVRQLTQDENALRNAIATVEQEIINAINSDEEFANATNRVNTSVHDLGKTAQGAVNDVINFGAANLTASEDINRLFTRLSYFLSLGNIIQLFRRTVRSAFNTVKELDAAMTETATVTDYSVGQMWDKLDEYTNIANKLGATTLGTYKTITMFFQQGLNEQQALELATETMKMARVANIDYAKATQYMTAALRGFNLELNETQATRVNDVYSELAKITAADTQQIAIAMSKVASLANSANMELETTSAFLSQIIETTQEAPETAGTALKTIIARFSEVKKLFTEGELTGTDEEGEEVDVNKIGAALRTAGINLNEFILGNVGLDEIFMQLAKKWDELTLVQQRYIATQAAGSRQQSRFIAMMQDYGRTVELVNAAYNSSGSGQEQFDKTLESIEAKLNKLKNAWASFTMAIGNSDIIKGAVDLLTGLLTTINNLTDSVPILKNKLGGFLRTLLAIGTFKLGRNMYNGAAAGFNNALIANPNNLLAGFSGALRGARGGLVESGQGILNYFRRNDYAEAENQITEKYARMTEQVKSNPNLTDAEKQGVIDRITNKTKQSLEELEKSGLKTTLTFENLGKTFQGVGAVTMILGAALKSLGNNLDNEVLVRAGECIQAFGMFAAGLGSILRYLPSIKEGFASIASYFGISSIQLLGVVSVIGVVIGAITALVKIYKKHREEAEKGNEALRNSFNTTNEQIADISNGIKSLNEAQDTLNSLTIGSANWSGQLSDINKQFNELIKKYPNLKKFIAITDHGFEIIDQAGLDEETKRLEEQSAQLQRADQIINAVSVRKVTLRDASTGEKHTEHGKVNSWALSRELEGTKYGALNLDELAPTLDNIAAEQTGKIADLSKGELIARFSKDLGIVLTEEEKNADIEELQKKYVSVIIGNFLEDAYQEAARNGHLPLTDLKGQNIYANYGQDYTDEGKKKLTEQLDASLANDESATALYGYWDSLEKLPPYLEEDTNALKGLALETASALKHFESLNEVLDKNKDLLKSGEENSEAYGVAIGKVWAAMKNIGSGISYDFVKQNIDNIMSAFQDGSEEALWKLQEELIKTFDINEFLKDKGLDEDGNVIPITLNETDIEKIKNELSTLTEDKEFRLNGVGDFSALWTLLTETLGLSQDVAEAMIKNFMIEGHLVTNEDGSFHYDVSSLGLQQTRNAKAGSKSKGGGSKKKNAWENPYDQLYNLTERNEEAIRRRNILEKEYNAILRDRLGSSSQLLKNSLQELANLQEQLAYQRRLQEGRIAQLNAVEGEMYTNSEGKRKSYADWGVTQYAHYNQQTNAIEIDWDAIDQVTDEEKGKAIEDYIKRLEELQKLYEQTQSDILDIEAAIDEINQRGKKDYLTFEQRIYDAIVKQYQDQIDAYASLSDQIDEANQEILDQLNEQIELERQIRDNTKKEEEIADKEARLAYLQRDTSGANQTEILALQKEIEEARQSYQDDLIDQQIEQIQKGNEAASEQRQKQIELMQAQLDYWTEIGAFWSRVSELIDEGINDDGTLKNNSALVELLMGADNFGGLSEFGKMNWMDELVKTFMQSMEGFGKWMMEQAENEGTITQDGLTYTYDKDKKAWMMNGEAYSAVYDPVTGQYIFTRNPTNDVQTGAIGGGGNGGSGGGGDNTGGPSTSYTHKFGPLEGWTYSYTDKHSGISDSAWKKVYSNFTDWIMRNKSYNYAMSVLEKYNFEKFKAALLGSGGNTSNGGNGPGNKLYNLILQQYKTGGMADYTGPAWLDGTRARPEAVLNADQTKLFISLRDVLSSLKSRGGRLNELHGDTYVDLDVNANIGSDYDVDSLVTRLKRDILESSNYRNANVLSRGY